MKLRKKTLFIVGAVPMALNLLLYATTSVFLQPDLPPLETLDRLGFVLSLSAVGLVYSLLILLVLDKWVLSRLHRLTESDIEARERPDLHQRLDILPEDDELSHLANTINTLLETLVQTEREQQETEARYQLLATHSTDWIARQTPEGIVLYASPACEVLLGYQPEELVGKNIYDLFHPQDLNTLNPTRSSTIAPLSTLTTSYRIRHKNNGYVWFETTSSAVRDPDTGQVQEVVSVSRDITERKLAEKDLRQGEASIRSMYKVTSSRQLNFGERLQGLLALGRLRFGLEIGILSRIEGRQFKVVEAQSPYEAIKKGDRFDLEQTYCYRTLEAKEPLHFEFLLACACSERPKYGPFSIEAYIGTPVIVAGEIYGTLSFSSARALSEPFKAVDREILKLMAQWIGGEIERQQAASELAKARDEAIAATQAKSDFLATMSHEIRTPMNAVIGMTGLLLDTPLTHQQQDFVQTIRNSGEALLTIINDILDFSKIESGKLELESQPFELRGCIEESLDLLASKAAQKGLELGYLIAPNTPVIVCGDITRLRQILVNLLSNAVKFTDGGEVVISVVPRPLSETKEDYYELQFAVRDTGIGIPQERMHRLFRSFSQVDSSTTRQYGGTGLGLAIGKRLAEMMGGQMWVQSGGAIAGDRPEELGSWKTEEMDPNLPSLNAQSSGSTFYFTAIVKSMPDALPAKLHPPHVELTGKRLLVVDDSPINRKILTLQAQAWGMFPHAVASGSQALDLLSQGTAFDVAILDMQMPGMDGLTLASKIRQQPGGQPLPLVMLTSLGASLVEIKAGEVEFAAFLNKPIKQVQLYNILAGVFSSQPILIKPTQPSSLKLDRTLAHRLPLRILLAEDNVVNQKVATQTLERMGYRADVVSNGQEVLEALLRQPYDVVLLDVQMPVMDGLEAAQKISQQWSDDRRPRLVALTANAMEGDREACMRAGMDDYISKPIRVEELVSALHRCRKTGEWENSDTISGSLSLDLSPTPNGQGTTTETLCEKILQDLREIDALEELIDLYLQESPKLVRKIQSALSQGDAVLLKDAAHSLKSTSAAIGAFPLSELGARLEEMGKVGDMVEAAAFAPQVELEYQNVTAALALERQACGEAVSSDGSFGAI